jgi:iron complex outermembrane receptor protein
MGNMKLVSGLGAAVLLALASPRAAAAQAELAGRVVDAGTGQPIAGASVRISAIGRAELSHADGVFHFHRIPAGEYVVSAARVGYAPGTATARLAAGRTDSVTIRLAPSAVELGALVVTGTLAARSRDEVLSATSVVSGRRLERELGSTVAATLERLPGVAATSIGPATARPVIRGLSSDRVLVLEDGQRPGDLSSTSGDHAVASDVLTARQVEVVRGPMSLLYGSSALGGVVNVIRGEVPTTRTEHVHGAATAQLTSADRGAASGAYAEGGAGRFVFRAEGSARASGDVRTPRGELRNTEARTLGASGGASYVGARGYAGASYRFYDNDYGIPGGFLGAHPSGVDIHMRRQGIRAAGELRPGSGAVSAVRGNVALTDYNHTEFESSGSVGTRFRQRSAAADVTAQHDERGILAQGAFGVRAQLRDVATGGSLRTPSTTDYTLAAFAVEEVGRGALRGQLGARYDFARFDPDDGFIRVGGERIPVRPRTFGSFSGSAGVLYDFGGGVRAGGSVARSYRTPDFNELYSNGPHLAAGTFDVGDPSLRQEVGVGVDGYVRVTRPTLRAEVAAFRNRLDGYIFPSTRGRVELGTQGGVARAQYTNEDALFTGAEADAEWHVVPRLVLEATASLVRARFTTERAAIPTFVGSDTVFVAASEYPPLIPPVTGRAGARWEDGPWSLRGSLRFAGRQGRTGDFEEPTDGYVVGDLAAGLRLRRGGRVHSITLRLDNVAGTEYRNHLSRTKVIMPEPGRSLGLLYRITY